MKKDLSIQFTLILKLLFIHISVSIFENYLFLVRKIVTLTDTDADSTNRSTLRVDYSKWQDCQHSELTE